MGAHGPVPKRDAERRRRNKPDVETTTVSVIAGRKVAAPPCPRDFHPIARRWYLSLRQSGQAVFYEPSDWAVALYVGHQMSRELENYKPSAEMFKNVLSAMGDLLATEGSRRRVRLELEREGEAPAAPVAVMDDYREALA